MNKLLLIFLLFAFITSAFSQELTEKEANELTAKLNSNSNTIHTLESEFTQEKYIDILADKIESKGKIFLKTPSKLKWQYLLPFKYTIIFSDSEILIDDEGKKSSFNVESSKVFNQINQLILNSIKGNLIDKTNFKPSFYHENDNYRIELIPLNQSIKEYFSKIILYVNKKTYLVDRIRLEENSEDYTLINFSNKIINKEIPDEEFKL